MSKKGITGHDDWVMTRALATALGRTRTVAREDPAVPHMEDLGNS